MHIFGNGRSSSVQRNLGRNKNLYPIWRDNLERERGKPRRERRRNAEQISGKGFLLYPCSVGDDQWVGSQVQIRISLSRYPSTCPTVSSEGLAMIICSRFHKTIWQDDGWKSTAYRTDCPRTGSVMIAESTNDFSRITRLFTSRRSNYIFNPTHQFVI